MDTGKEADVANGGLPQNSCPDVYFDRKSGFLWITTEGGLVRYDGKEQLVFDMHNLKAVETPRMGRFFCTTDGSVFTIGSPGTPVVIHDNEATAMTGGIGPHWLAFTRASCVNVRYLLTHHLVYPSGNDDAYALSYYERLMWIDETRRVSVYRCTPQAI